MTVERRLIDERFGAPGQFLRALALGNGENDSFHNDCSDKRHFTTEVWVGDVVSWLKCCPLKSFYQFYCLMKGAMDVVWCADVDITAVIYIRPTEHFPPHSAWLRKDRKKSEQLDYRGEAQNIVKFASFVINDPASKSDDDCWKKVLEIIPPVLEFIRNISKVGRLDIDHTLNSYFITIAELISDQKHTESCRLR